MKKLCPLSISIILVASLLILPISAAIEVPSSASSLTVPIEPRFIFANYPYSTWYVSNTTPLMDEWQYGELNDQSPIIAPGIIFTEDQDEATYMLKDTTTYYFQYELTTNNNIAIYGLSTNAEIYRAVPNFMITEVFGDITVDTTQVGRDFRNYLDWCPELKEISRNIDTEITQIGSSKYRIKFVFNTKSGVEAQKLCGLLLFSNGALQIDDRLEFVSVQAWSDESLSIYEELVSGQLKDINDSINDLNGTIVDGFEGIQGSLDDLNDTLIGDPVQDNTGFNDSVDDLSQLEADIKELLESEKLLPNGGLFDPDENSILHIKDYMLSHWNPQDYEDNAGKEIRKVFDFFMPYMAVPVFTNLLLGLAFGFFRGRTNA